MSRHHHLPISVYFCCTYLIACCHHHKKVTLDWLMVHLKMFASAKMPNNCTTTKIPQMNQLKFNYGCPAIITLWLCNLGYHLPVDKSTIMMTLQPEEHACKNICVHCVCKGCIKNVKRESAHRHSSMSIKCSINWFDCIYVLTSYMLTKYLHYLYHLHQSYSKHILNHYQKFLLCFLRVSNVIYTYA